MTERDEDLRVAGEDPAGEQGGDTGQSRKKGTGEQAEKGDWRRNKPVHAGPTRNSRDARSRGENQRAHAASDRSDHQGDDLEDL